MSWNTGVFILGTLALGLTTISDSKADFDLGLEYAQSRDFWRIVQDVQDKTGDLDEINPILSQHYGKPETIFSIFRAGYSKNHNSHDDVRLEIGTRAEAVAGGQISNPVFPEIAAYSSSVGIFSLGFDWRDSLDDWGAITVTGLAGFGPERRLYASGADFVENIPIRAGDLFLGALEFRPRFRFWGDDGFIARSNFFARPEYFASTVSAAREGKDDGRSFFAFRWQANTEWLKAMSSSLSDRAQFGVAGIMGQDPLPDPDFLPVTWDYQQRLETFPAKIGNLFGAGGIFRLFTEHLSRERGSLFEVQAGLYGLHPGASLTYRFDSFFISAGSFGLENRVGNAPESTRVWTGRLGFLL